MPRRKIGTKIERRLAMDRQLLPESVPASEYLTDDRTQEERKESKRQTIAPEDSRMRPSPQPRSPHARCQYFDLVPPQTEEASRREGFSPHRAGQAGDITWITRLAIRSFALAA